MLSSVTILVCWSYKVYDQIRQKKTFLRSAMCDFFNAGNCPYLNMSQINMIEKFKKEKIKIKSLG